MFIRFGDCFYHRKIVFPSSIIVFNDSYNYYISVEFIHAGILEILLRFLAIKFRNFEKFDVSD